MMILGAISVGWMVYADKMVDRGELHKIICDIASEFAQCQPREPRQ